MKTLILSDGLDGHYNQSIGIAAILQETTLPSYKVVEVKLKFTFLRGLQYTYIKLLSKNLTNTNIKIILSFFNKIDPSEYDLLISTGGKLSVFNAAIAKKFNIKNIHNGSLRGISNEYFEATIVLGGKIKKNSNSIHTILPPNRFNPLNHAKNKNKVFYDHSYMKSYRNNIRYKTKEVNIFYFLNQFILFITHCLLNCLINIYFLIILSFRAV